jgi:hypothetical protein
LHPLTDQTGKLLLKIDLVDEIKGRLRTSGQAAWGWIGQKLQPLADTLNDTKAAAAQSFVKSMDGTPAWRQARELAARLGNIPLVQDSKKLVDARTVRHG